MSADSRVVQMLRDKRRGCPTCEGIDPKSCLRCRGKSRMQDWYSEEATALIESLLRDARRYRWINKHHNFLVYVEAAPGKQERLLLRCGLPLDEYIDRRIDAATAPPAAKAAQD